MNSTITIILDLDGVLITTPKWKADEMNSDGYSKFNENCVANFNQLLDNLNCEIYLSSSRRVNKSFDQFNTIFNHRGLQKSITDYVPVYENCKNRKEEVLQFLKEKGLTQFLIIDDDKTLNDLPKEYKDKLILTEYLIGFDKNKLTEARKKLKHLGR